MNHSLRFPSYQSLFLCALALSQAIAACTGNGETNGSGNTTTSASGSGGQGGMSLPPECAASPSDDPSVLIDACGVFTSPGGDDANGDGTSQKPFRTLGFALMQAGSKGSRIYACKGDYPESISVPAGMQLYGGLNCGGNPWTVGGDGDRSIISAAPGDIAVRVLAGTDAAQETRLDGFEAAAANATLAGGSSIALIVEENPHVTLSNCTFRAGDAMAGENGESAPQIVPDTPIAAAANKGTAACTSATLNNGGLPTTNSCSTGEMSIGGAGGDGTVLLGQSGQNGSPPDPTMPLSGMGGAGDVACGMGSGTTGANGVSGAPGAGGSGLGSLSAADGFLGVAGADGGQGKVGQGGGGGGGRKGAAGCAGASGGAGGAGACGGAGGKGGGAGGSSIALISLNSTVELLNVTLIAGLGGQGGKGGDAQLGGTGGKGSVGGASNGMLPAGCPGGDGGDGGNGGSGGGGLGGHSLSMAYIGKAPLGKPQMSIGSAGAGGLGGNNNAQMNAGQAGAAQESVEFPSP